MNEQLLQQCYPAFKFIRSYHRHRVVGLSNIPERGPAILAVTHSLATYDIGMLLTAIFETTGRIPRSLADNLFFKIPFLGELVEAIGGEQGCPANALRLLSEGEIVTVAPGGMREGLRPSSERYQILWENRRGFAKLAMDAGVPVILAACPKADDIYEVYKSPVTRWAYDNFRVPVFMARGLGLSFIPKPVTLTHFVSEPLMPPEVSDNPQTNKRRLAKFHKELVKRMRLLISDAIAWRED